MIRLIFIYLLLTQYVQANEYLDKTHVTAGVGYKLNQSIDNFEDEKYKDSPTARIEVYYQHSPRVKVGISHHSQWFKGRPFNDDWEYAKTELFVDYTFSLGDVF